MFTDNKTKLRLRSISRDCVQNGSPYHLFRLLMLYHDPELCAFLDTKKIAPDSYAHLWVIHLLLSRIGRESPLNNFAFFQFRSLFAARTNVDVTLSILDMYFQLGDQFLIFFMSLILVFNMRDEIMAASDMDKSELLSK